MPRPFPTNAAPAGGATLRSILTEDGDRVAGPDPDSPRSRPADGDRAEPAPAGTRPRIARRRPSPDPVLPAVTDDERDVGWGEMPEPDDDERLLREVPPHHGS
jgi:hypothetical protein